MSILDRFRRTKAPDETRNYTSQMMASRFVEITGQRGIADLTATVQGCISLWESGLSLADVNGTDALTPRDLTLMARQLGLTWLHQNSAPQKRIPVTEEPVILLDQTLRDELLALAEIGHLSALRERLDEAKAKGQLPTALAGDLDSRLTLFDFQAVIRLLETAA